MRPPTVFANASGSELALLRGKLRGPWRVAVRAQMVLLSLQGLSPTQISVLLECDPATVRRWIGRFDTAGVAGLADRPRSGRPRLGGGRLTARIIALLERLWPWTVCKLHRYLGRPRMSRRTLYRRLRQVAVWRRPKLIARGDPARDGVTTAIRRRMTLLPAGAKVPTADETHVHLLPHVRARWTLPGRRPEIPRRQVHTFFRGHSPDQNLATAAPWTSPWFPAHYRQDFWTAAENASRRVSRRRAMFDRGKLRPVIGAVLPLADIAQAHTLLEGGSAGEGRGRPRGKIAVAVQLACSR
ncbi:helix-turn-helix domain-containing protein [Streptomyces lasiicapitis]|uniref:helix-turn-helix domain-containing protein n=1 Tax=Streptomyces lasiicapitis TaxID=1923961 RepID=UPI003570C1F3